MNKARILINELLAATSTDTEVGADPTTGGVGQLPPGRGGGGGDSGDGWKGGDGGDGPDEAGEAYDLVTDAGIQSSSHTHYDMNVNRPGWQKLTRMLSQKYGRQFSIKDVASWIVKFGPMPGIETLWVMTKDPRLRAITDFEESDGGDQLCVSYFYGGHERRAAFVKYGSRDPEKMAKSIFNCLNNLHDDVELNGTTVTLTTFDESDGEWGPTEIVKGLREGGWQVNLDNDGSKFTVTVLGFGQAEHVTPTR